MARREGGTVSRCGSEDAGGAGWLRWRFSQRPISRRVKMTTVIPQLNTDLGEVADRVRKSLIRVTAGHHGSGSGVVFNSDGLVVTNAHVVSGK